MVINPVFRLPLHFVISPTHGFGHGSRPGMARVRVKMRGSIVCIVVSSADCDGWVGWIGKCKGIDSSTWRRLDRHVLSFIIVARKEGGKKTSPR